MSATSYDDPESTHWTPHSRHRPTGPSGKPPENVAIECVTCHEVLLDFNRPAQTEVDKDSEQFAGLRY